MRKEELGVQKSNSVGEDVMEEDSVEILDDSTDDVKEEMESKEGEGDDIWDNMVMILKHSCISLMLIPYLQVVIDQKKKRKSKEQDLSKSKRLK